MLKNSEGYSQVVILLILSLILITSILFIFKNSLKINQNNDFNLSKSANTNEQTNNTNINSTSGPENTLDEDPLFKTLTISPLSEEIKIVDNLNKIEFSVPVTYNLSGVSENYFVTFTGINMEDSNKQKNFSELQFKQMNLNKNLYDLAKDEYSQYFSKTNGTNPKKEKDFSNIKEIMIGNIKGYSYNCSNNLKQSFFYLPILGNSTKYLLIVKSFDDTYNRGYSQELDNILNSIKYEK